MASRLRHIGDVAVDPRDARIAELEALVTALLARDAEREAVVARLEKRVAELEEKLLEFPSLGRCRVADVG